MKKFVKNNIFGFILGILMAGSVGVLAYSYQANQIGYTTSHNDSVQNVEQAINDLYDKYNNYLKPIELTLGQTYQMGGYDWIAAEKIDGGYVMQSTGMTSGTWPGYKLTGNYDGTKSYGNANTNYTSNIDGDNIANYDDVTLAFYEAWKSCELTTASYGKGLFLVSNAKCGTTTSGSQGKGYYFDALNKPNKAFWIGNNGGTIAWYVYNNKVSVEKGTYFNEDIAPAFNLDASKVYLDGTEIKKK